MDYDDIKMACRVNDRIISIANEISNILDSEEGRKLDTKFYQNYDGDIQKSWKEGNGSIIIKITASDSKCDRFDGNEYLFFRREYKLEFNDLMNDELFDECDNVYYDKHPLIEYVWKKLRDDYTEKKEAEKQKLKNEEEQRQRLQKKHDLEELKRLQNKYAGIQ